MPFSRLAWLSAGLVLLAILGDSVPASAQALLIVDDTSDGHDMAPGDRRCETSRGTCTLRAAIEEANARAGGETIGISVPAGDFHLEYAASDVSYEPWALRLSGDVVISGAGTNSTSVRVRADGEWPKIALLVEEGASALIEGVSFNGETTRGGIRVDGRLVLRGCAITTHRGGVGSAPLGVGSEGELELHMTIVSANEGAVGAVYNFGHLSLVRTTLQSNYGTSVGAIENFGRASIEESTLASNVGEVAAIKNSGNMTIRNSTVSANVSSGSTGLVATTGQTLDNTGDLAIEFSTITRNRSPNGSGLSNRGGSLTISSTIVAGNLHPLGGATATPQCWGAVPIESRGYNLFGDRSCGYDAERSDIESVDPLLGRLADNGGPTLTHLPTSASPAVDAGDPSVHPTTDQRGVARPQGARADIGACEVTVGTSQPPVSPTPWPLPPTDLEGLSRGLLAPYGYLDGTITDLAPVGDLWAAGIGADLVLLRPGKTTTMEPVGRVELPGTVNALGARWPYIYAALSTRTLHVIEISVPSRPREVGTVATPSSDQIDGPMVVAGDTLFAAGSRYGAMRTSAGTISAFRIADPTAPRMLSRLELNAGRFGAMSISNRTLYAVGNSYHGFGESSSRLAVIDVTNPLSMREIGRVDFDTASPDLAVIGPTAYLVSRVADDGSGYSGISVLAVDVSTPEEPAVLGVVSGTDGAEAIEAVGRSVLVARRKGRGNEYELVAYQLNGSTDWLRRRAASIDSVPLQMVAGNDGTGLLEQDSTFSIYRYRASDSLHRIGGHETPGTVEDVVPANGVVLTITSDKAALRVVDASLPGKLGQVGAIGHDTIAPRVLVVDSDIAVYCGDGGFSVVDFRDASEPVVVGRHRESSFGCIDAAIDRDRLITVGWDRIRTFDISDPTAPAFLVSQDLPEGVSGIRLHEGIAYLAIGSQLVVGRIDPNGRFELLSQMEPSPHAGLEGIAVEGEIAYVVLGIHLALIDVADPSRPRELAAIRLPGRANALDVENGYAFVAGYRHGVGEGRLWVVDLSDPANLRVVDDQPLPGLVKRLRAKSRFVYSAAGRGGLRVLRYSAPEAPRFTSHCGMTNRTLIGVDGTAPADSTLNLYDSDVLVAQRQLIGPTFALSVSLAAGDHTLSADALTDHGLSSRSGPLPVAIRPELPYDPIGVRMTYGRGRAQRGQAPVGRSGCVDPTGGWWIRPSPAVAFTVTVPVRYVTAAHVSVTVGSKAQIASEYRPGLFHAEFPPVDDLASDLTRGEVPFVIHLDVDGERRTVQGAALTRRVYLPQVLRAPPLQSGWLP